MSACYNLGCRKALSTREAASRDGAGLVCYNLGCRKALSTPTTDSSRHSCSRVLQPRMSKGVEHWVDVGFNPQRPIEVLQPRMSKGVEHWVDVGFNPQRPIEVLQPRMSKGVEHLCLCRYTRVRVSRCYNLGCRKALSTRPSSSRSFSGSRATTSDVERR